MGHQENNEPLCIKTPPQPHLIQALVPISVASAFSTRSTCERGGGIILTSGEKGWGGQAGGKGVLPAWLSSLQQQLLQQWDRQWRGLPGSLSWCPVHSPFPLKRSCASSGKEVCHSDPLCPSPPAGQYWAAPAVVDLCGKWAILSQLLGLMPCWPTPTYATASIWRLPAVSGAWEGLQRNPTAKKVA